MGDHKMAIRGGFGIYYDRIFDNIWFERSVDPPFYALADFEADTGDAIYYSNPASIGAAYDPKRSLRANSVSLKSRMHREEIEPAEHGPAHARLLRQNFYLGVLSGKSRAACCCA